MKIAALDLGSNTFLLLVAEVKDGQIKRVYRDELRVTRLGQGVHQNKRFHPEALLRARECFREYSEIIQFEKPDRVVAMATSAARDVENGQALFDLGKEYGIPIQIIPGHLEATITFRGSTFDLPSPEGVAVIDVGGGSTEVIAQTTGHSLDVGSVRLTELFVSAHPVPKGEVEKISQYVKAQIDAQKRNLPRPPVKTVVAVAGTPTTLAAVVQGRPYSHSRVHGFKLSMDDLLQWQQRLAEMTVPARQALMGMDPKRADVIVAGLTILIEVLKYLRADHLIVSDYGVRYGIALMAAQEGS